MKNKKNVCDPIIERLDDDYETKKKEIIICIQKYFELENSYFLLPEELKNNKELIQERHIRHKKLVESYNEGEKAYLNLVQELNARKEKDPSFQSPFKRKEKVFINWFITVFDIYR